MHITRVVGFLGLLLALPSSCGSNNDKAAGCSAMYALGCVGDGRPASSTTPAKSPTNSCASSAYTYFKLDLALTNSSVRSQISTCTLDITNSKGNLIEEYSLPSVEAAGGNQGCAGLAHAVIGTLSYASCCAASDTLQFTLLVKDANDAVLATGTASGPCSKDGVSLEVAVSLSAK
jgi:hypothetical protein